MPRRIDLVIAPVCEAGLILLAGAVAWGVHKPLLFASLGPTAYELVETPERQSAKPYSVLVGHLAGIVAAFTAIAITSAWSAPSPSQSGVPLVRVATAVIAAGLTVLFTLLVKATQPAALSTTLLLALGVLRGWVAIPEIMGSVLLLTMAGEPLRKWRERDTGRKESNSERGSGQQ